MSKARQRVVLITGASSGIGRACALHLAGRGFQVYGTSRRAGSELGEGGLREPREQEGTTGMPAMLSMDVTDDKSVEQGISTILNREGRLDVVVNNAGMGIAGPIEETSVDEAKRQFEVNFFGTFRVCHAVLPILRQQGSGFIVNIGSIAGLIALPYQALYSASKFALEGLTEALRLEVNASGIRVVLIQPGDHKTDFTRNRQRTEASGGHGVYGRPFGAALERMTYDEQHGPDPERIARLLDRILQSRNPRLRYTVGPSSQRAAVWLKRLLPYAAMEQAMKIYYRLDD